MQFYEEDINYWEGWSEKLIKSSDVEGMKYLCEVITSRVLEVGHNLINSDENNLINYLEDNNNFELYKEIGEGLYKHIATVSLPKSDDKYIYVREDVIVQGISKDEEGNLKEADIIGIKIDVVEPINETEYADVDNTTDEDNCIIVDEDFINNEFFRCNELIKIEKGNENKFVSF